MIKAEVVDEFEYKQAIKDARRLGNQITYRMDVVAKAQEELRVMEEQHQKLIAKIKQYEDGDA